VSDCQAYGACNQKNLFIKVDKVFMIGYTMEFYWLNIGMKKRKSRTNKNKAGTDVLSEYQIRNLKARTKFLAVHQLSLANQQAYNLEHFGVLETWNEDTMRCVIKRRKVKLQPMLDCPQGSKANGPFDWLKGYPISPQVPLGDLISRMNPNKMA
jgi:hypothetical protein